MPDLHYPFVNLEFIKEKVQASGKLAKNGIVQIGATTSSDPKEQEAFNSHSQ